MSCFLLCWVLPISTWGAHETETPSLDSGSTAGGITIPQADSPPLDMMLLSRWDHMELSLAFTGLPS